MDNNAEAQSRLKGRTGGKKTNNNSNLTKVRRNARIVGIFATALLTAVAARFEVQCDAADGFHCVIKSK